MRVRLSLAVSVLALSACAAFAPRTWSHPEPGRSLAADSVRCDGAARRAAEEHGGRPDGVMEDLNFGVAKRHLFERCMRGEGWERS
jgi:hypothetical protein